MQNIQIYPEIFQEIVNEIHSHIRRDDIDYSCDYKYGEVHYFPTEWLPTDYKGASSCPKKEKMKFSCRFDKCIDREVRLYIR